MSCDQRRCVIAHTHTWVCQESCLELESPQSSLSLCYLTCQCRVLPMAVWCVVCVVCVCVGISTQHTHMLCELVTLLQQSPVHLATFALQLHKGRDELQPIIKRIQLTLTDPFMRNFSSAVGKGSVHQTSIDPHVLCHPPPPKKKKKNTPWGYLTLHPLTVANPLSMATSLEVLGPNELLVNSIDFVKQSLD